MLSNPVERRAAALRPGSRDAAVADPLQTAIVALAALIAAGLLARVRFRHAVPPPSDVIDELD